MNVDDKDFQKQNILKLMLQLKGESCKEKKKKRKKTRRHRL